MKLSRLTLACFLTLNIPLSARAEAPTSASVMAECATILSTLRHGERVEVAEDAAVYPGGPSVKILGETPTFDDLETESDARTLAEAAERMATRPNYRDETGFAMTQMYVGEREIKDFVRTIENQAKQLDEEARRQLEAKVFSKVNAHRYLRRAAGSLSAYASAWALSVIVPLAIQHYGTPPPAPEAIAAATFGIATVGALYATIATGRDLAWATRLLRAYVDPDRRRAVLDQVGVFVPSDYAEDIRTKISDIFYDRDSTATGVMMAFESHDYEASRSLSDGFFEGSAEQARANAIDFLAGAKRSKIPAWVNPLDVTRPIPAARVRVKIFNFLIKDSNGRLALIVHAHGANLVENDDAQK